MTQIERIFNALTGETTERELSEKELAELNATKSFIELQNDQLNGK